MTSLCRHLSAQEIVNWVTTADGCVHTDDTTKLSPTSCELVSTPPTPTRQNSFVPSAVCLGIRDRPIIMKFSRHRVKKSRSSKMAIMGCASVDLLPPMFHFVTLTPHRLANDAERIDA